MSSVRVHRKVAPFTCSEKLLILKISYETTMYNMLYILLHIFVNAILNFAFIYWKLTPWFRVLTDKLIVAHVVNNSPPPPFFFLELKDRHPILGQMNPVYSITLYFSTINFNTIPASNHRPSNLQT